MASDDENVSFKKASAVRKGDIVLLKGTHPCKIVEMSTSKTGKHGSAKVHLVGLDIFTGKKLEALFGSTDDVTLPDIDKVDMLLVEIKEDGRLVATDRSGETFTNVQIPAGQLSENMKKAHEARKPLTLCVACCMGKKVVTTYKERKNGRD
jgi:translation initiation factor 5A